LINDLARAIWRWAEKRREERARDRKSQFGCKARFMGSNYYLPRIRQQFHGIATGDNTDNPENDESRIGRRRNSMTPMSQEAVQVLQAGPLECQFS